MKIIIPDLARKINEREEVIEQLVEQTAEKANQAIMEAILQGRDLLALKAQCKHGEWLDTLKAHCPSISEDKAHRRMKLASDPQRYKELEQAQSLRAALLLFAPNDPAAEQQQSKRWPEFQEGMGRAWKFIEFAVRHPIDQWPEPALDELRHDLEPVAAKLWPDRFSAPISHTAHPNISNRPPYKESIRPSEGQNR